MKVTNSKNSIGAYIVSCVFGIWTILLFYALFFTTSWNDPHDPSGLYVVIGMIVIVSSITIVSLFRKFQEIFMIQIDRFLKKIEPFEASLRRFFKVIGISIAIIIGIIIFIILFFISGYIIASLSATTIIIILLILILLK